MVNISEKETMGLSSLHKFLVDKISVAAKEKKLYGPNLYVRD